MDQKVIFKINKALDRRVALEFIGIGKDSISIYSKIGKIILRNKPMLCN